MLIVVCHDSVEFCLSQLIPVLHNAIQTLPPSVCLSVPRLLIAEEQLVIEYNVLDIVFQLL